MTQQYPLCDSLLEKSVINEFSLVYKWTGKNSKLAPILLMGHSDVVPVEGESLKQWTEDPYGGKISKGYIWGRGTLDDKVNVLGILEATERLLLEGYQPMRTVYFAFGHDEEIGGKNGAQAIARRFQQQGLEFEYILGEGMVILEKAMPGIDPTLALIGIAEKGYATLELTAKIEKGGHSSMPPSTTAIGLLSQAIKHLENQPFPARIDGPTKLLFDYVGPEMNWPNKAIFANLWLFKTLLINQLSKAPTTNAVIRTTTATTMIRGGVKDNVLPTEAKAWINFRIYPGETVDDVIAQVQNTIKEPLITIKSNQESVFTNNPSPVSEIESFGFMVLQRSIKEIFPGVIVAPSLVIAATDARHYSQLSKNIYRFSPLQLNNEDFTGELSTGCAVLPAADHEQL